jgi:hypothetical protein
MQIVKQWQYQLKRGCDMIIIQCSHQIFKYHELSQMSFQYQAVWVEILSLCNIVIEYVQYRSNPAQ